MTIRTKQFQLLTDAELAWELMTDVFTPDECNGPAAPFFEYALASSWQDKTYLRLNRFWLDGDKPVGFLFYEDDPNRLHFVLRPGYEALAGEMIDYGETAFPAFGEPRELVLNQGQKALIEAAEARGYRAVDQEEYKVFNFRAGQLSRPLPSGYHFAVGRSLAPALTSCIRAFWAPHRPPPPTPPTSAPWSSPTRRETTFVSPACGGWKRTSSPTWSPCAPSPGIGTRAWPPRPYPNMTGCCGPWAPGL